MSSLHDCSCSLILQGLFRRWWDLSPNSRSFASNPTSSQVSHLWFSPAHPALWLTKCIWNVPSVLLTSRLLEPSGYTSCWKGESCCCGDHVGCRVCRRCKEADCGVEQASPAQWNVPAPREPLLHEGHIAHTFKLVCYSSVSARMMMQKTRFIKFSQLFVLLWFLRTNS